jgi:hypothetical protein
MQDGGNTRGRHVVGPDGTLLTQASLPQSQGTRWVARRKAEVVIAVCSGIITMADACARYAIAPDEFLGWERAYMQKGMPGLRLSSLAHSR